jgi:hypothetical protein
LKSALATIYGNWQKWAYPLEYETMHSPAKKKKPLSIAPAALAPDEMSALTTDDRSREKTASIALGAIYYDKEVESVSRRLAAGIEIGEKELRAAGQSEAIGSVDSPRSEEEDRHHSDNDFIVEEEEVEGGGKEATDNDTIPPPPLRRKSRKNDTPVKTNYSNDELLQTVVQFLLNKEAISTDDIVLDAFSPKNTAVKTFSELGFGTVLQHTLQELDELRELPFHDVIVSNNIYVHSRLDIEALQQAYERGNRFAILLPFDTIFNAEATLTAKGFGLLIPTPQIEFFNDDGRRVMVAQYVWFLGNFPFTDDEAGTGKCVTHLINTRAGREKAGKEAEYTRKETGEETGEGEQEKE